MRKPLVAFMGVVGGLLASGTVQARTVEFLSRHPIPRQLGGGFCYIEVAHLHNYGPADPRLYREINGQFYFVGDPSPFQFEGPRYAYFGAHPVMEVEVRVPSPIYCYLKGPHYHPYKPPAHASFQFKGGAYWFVGTFPPSYYDDQPRYVVVNDAYAPVHYVRPTVDVHAPPVGFSGEISLGGPGFRATAVVGGHAHAPVPPPSPAIQLGVGISIGGGQGPDPVRFRRPHRVHRDRVPRFFHPSRSHANRPLRVRYDPRQDIARQPIRRAAPARSRSVSRPPRHRR